MNIVYFLNNIEVIGLQVVIKGVQIIRLSYNFPYYSEQYTCDGSHDWLIYTSHEATVTFAGEWLVKAIKNEFHIDEIDIISNNKYCSNCGKVTGHFKYVRNIVYQCPSCKNVFYFK